MTIIIRIIIYKEGVLMVAYAQNELASSTELSKQFGHYLSNISNGLVEKLAILKNNKIEAVMIPASMYESLMTLLDEKENEELIKMVKERKQTSKQEYIDGPTLLKELNLSLDA
jgi:PHD/YefM family antitoxin component YafN of YafNO toxin-antitoxin module